MKLDNQIVFRGRMYVRMMILRTPARATVKTEILVAFPAEKALEIIKKWPRQSIPKAPAKFLFLSIDTKQN